VDDWPDLLIRLAFAAAILVVAWMFCREWRRWRESREDNSMTNHEPDRKIGHQVFADGVAREASGKVHLMEPNTLVLLSLP
jgi:hypothetical protein